MCGIAVHEVPRYEVSPSGTRPDSSRPARPPLKGGDARTRPPVVLPAAPGRSRLAVAGRGVLGSAGGRAELAHRTASYEGFVVGQRVTRTVLGLLTGCALAVSGAIMQAVTRNPMAEPGLLGVSSGPSLAVVLGSLAGLTAVHDQLLLASAGAHHTAIAAVIAAKGVVRFPEISRDEGGGKAEEFLIGSLASWTLAVLAAALLIR